MSIDNYTFGNKPAMLLQWELENPGSDIVGMLAEGLHINMQHNFHRQQVELLAEESMESALVERCPEVLL